MTKTKAMILGTNTSGYSLIVAIIMMLVNTPMMMAANMRKMRLNNGSSDILVSPFVSGVYHENEDRINQKQTKP